MAAPLKAFGLWAFNMGKQINATFLNQQITIHRLETQPMLDGVSCGYHSTGALLTMIDCIDKDECNTKQITSAIIGNHQYDLRAEALLNSEEKKKISLISPALKKLPSQVPARNAAYNQKKI